MMRPNRAWRRAYRKPGLLAVPALLLATVEADTSLPTLTDDSSTTATDDSASTSTDDSAAATSTETSSDTASTTDSSTGSSATTTGSSSSSDLPSLSSSSNTLPTLSSTATSYNYPPPTVPPTANAPYMQKSNLPEGTVFICVGAALAFIGLVMIVWRVAVTWWINRSVREAALASLYPRDTKSSNILQPRKKSGMYSQASNLDSNVSLEKLSKEGRHASMATPSSSLFFSPTAGAGMHTTGNRTSSGYLPAGYYSTSNPSAGNGMPMTQVGGTGTRRPQSGDRYGPLVPGVFESGSQHASPDLPPSRIPGGESTTTLSTGVTGSRAPSHYLDDLMSIPPLPPPGEHRRRGSSPRR